MLNIKENPAAYAVIKGSKKYPDLKGRVDFYDTYGGTIVIAYVHGMPGESKEDSQGFHGFHIHAGHSCTGNEQEVFADADGHYNPGSTEHPNHVGDLPPLLSNNGTAWMAVYTARFYPENVIGRTVIIHENADDFHTQPSGNAGEMIACGEIMAWEREIR